MFTGQWRKKMVNKRLVWLLVVAAVLLVVVPAFAQDQMMTYTVMTGSNADLGSFLVDSNGMTLYMFTADTPGATTCTDQCATNWPPLTVDSMDAVPTTLPGLPGDVSVIERTDMTYQVAYNGMPLYYFVKDTAPGDAVGQGVNNVWWVVQPPTVNLSNNADLGDFVVGPDGMTLYTFTNDTENTSNCYDKCAVNWPPLLVAPGETPSAGDGVMGDLGTTERTDGATQVTYNGMPLYYYIKDVVPGDTVGQNVGEKWFVTH